MNTGHHSRPSPAWRRPVASTPYPFFYCVVKQAVLIIAAVFLFAGGIFLGHFATTAWPGPSHWFGSRRALDTVVLEKLQSELDLTPAQTTQAAPIIAAACSNLRLLSEESRASRLALLDEVSTSIAPQLSPDQQHRLEALQAELQKRPQAKRDLRIVALF